MSTYITRKEYFEKLRSLLLQLDDKYLGIYMLHYTGSLPYRNSIPTSLDLSYLELYNRLWPNYSIEILNEKIFIKITDKTLKKLVDNIHIVHKSSSSRNHYESAIITIGQKTRDLLRKDPVAHWNALSQKIKPLKIQLDVAEDVALAAESYANEKRKTANNLREQIESIQKEILNLENQ